MTLRGFFEDGKLHYIKKKMSTEVVCGAQKAGEIFKDFHDSSTGGHCGQKKTLEAITKRFYWPGITVDLLKWVSM